MLKFVLTPKENMLHLSVLNNYVGKEIKILLYVKVELLEVEMSKDNFSRFKNLLTSEKADKYYVL